MEGRELSHPSLYNGSALEFIAGTCQATPMRFPHLPAALLGVCFFTSCATRPTEHPVEAASAAPAEEFKLPKREARPALIPIALQPNVEAKAETPPAPLPVEPTRAEKIIRLVQNGGLIQADRNTLVFSKFRKAPDSQTSLYEDAIILGRLRRQLKQVKALPDDVLSSATIRDARAYLVLDDGIALLPAAGAIDAALKTAGVAAVHARIFSPMRL